MLRETLPMSDHVLPRQSESRRPSSAADAVNPGRKSFTSTTRWGRPGYTHLRGRELDDRPREEFVAGHGWRAGGGEVDVHDILGMSSIGPNSGRLPAGGGGMFSQQ